MHLHDREPLIFISFLAVGIIKEFKCYTEISILVSLVGLQLSEPIIAFNYSVLLDFFFRFFRKYM